MPTYAARPLTSDDARIVARQRALMFIEMHEVPADDAEALEAATAEQIAPLIVSGEYFGWLMDADGAPVAGVGVFLHRLLPRSGELGLRQEAYIVNVWTDPAHRRRGLCRALMQEVIAWCRAHQVTRLTLHASAAGRPLYEGLGFAPTNEMRLVLR